MCGGGEDNHSNPLTYGIIEATGLLVHTYFILVFYRSINEIYKPRVLSTKEI
jgi:hypothetical protein